MKRKLTQSTLKRMIREEKAKLVKEAGTNQQMWYKTVNMLKKYVINVNNPVDAAGIILNMLQEAMEDVDDRGGKYWSKFADRLRNQL